MKTVAVLILAVFAAFAEAVREHSKKRRLGRDYEGPAAGWGE